MQRKIIKTADGSHTIRIEQWDEQYHSKHGAISESYHVFIEMGLRCIDKTEISILEMGFGTGLNALITLIESQRNNLDISYTAIEAFPVANEEWQALNYPNELEAESYRPLFEMMHTSPWEESVPITEDFSLTKLKMDMRVYASDSEFDLIYFDAFGYRVQPELWNPDIFKKMFQSLRPGGVLVTYAAKGVVRRTLQQVGFEVERLPGPPGKREMLRARKIVSG